MDDIAKWELMRRGDELALRDLYMIYYQTLINFGLKYTTDRDQIKDSINSSFLYFWEKRNTISEAKNVKNYIITSFVRQLNKDINRIDYLDINTVQSPELIYDSDEVILISEQDEISRINVLMKAILHLPTRQKELIILRFYEGLSYEEIAEKTQLTKRSVYNQIHLAINTLKKDSNLSDLKELVIFLPLLIQYLN